ncbi:MAG: hypothetical protein U1F87_14165 [Kiritimatiellia bacterium]
MQATPACKLVHRQLKYACKCERCAQVGHRRPCAPPPGRGGSGVHRRRLALMAHIIVAQGARDHCAQPALREQFSRLGWGAGGPRFATFTSTPREGMEPLYECLKGKPCWPAR